jgi:hypothetical protein
MRLRFAGFAVLLVALVSALAGSVRAQEFYGTGSSYTGQKVPIQTLNAIDAEKRRQSAAEAKIRSQQRQLDNDRQRALTTGKNLDCVGKTAAQTNCAIAPMPQFDRRANTLKQESQESDQQSEERIRKLQPPQ